MKLTKSQLKEIIKEVLLNEQEVMSKHLQNSFKGESIGGFRLWADEMIEDIEWTNKAAQKQYFKKWKTFKKGYDELLKFVITAEKKGFIKKLKRY